MGAAAGTRDRSWLAEVLREMFVVDLRSLAAMRIALGGLILVDLLMRARDLTAHYTELGVAPRGLVFEQYGWWTWLSPYSWASGSPVAVAGVFAVHAVAAGALLIGLRTRVATAACWFMAAALIARNPTLHNAGDRILQLLLFWSMLLPLGARWSVDARRDSRLRGAASDYHSVGAAALLLQVCFIYWFSVAYKSLTPLWADGQAVAFALGVDSLVTPLGMWLRQFEGLLRPLTSVVLVVEVVGPAVALIPGFAAGRMLAVFGFIGLHVGFGLCLALGVFPFISAAGWLAFLPAAFWDRLPGSARVAAAADPLAATPAVNRLAAVLLVLMALLNVRSLPPTSNLVPRFVEALGDTLRLKQAWAMFTWDKPLHGWFVVPGTLADGREVSLLGTGPADPVPWEQPEVVNDVYPNLRWIQFLHVHPRLPESPWWPSYADYLCRRWNRDHDAAERLVRLSIGFMHRTEKPSGGETVRHVVFLEHTCP